MKIRVIRYHKKKNDCSPVTKLKGTGYCNLTYKELKIAVMMKLNGPQVNSELSPGGSDGKESACNAGEPGSIPGLERCPGEGNGNPFQYSCLENPMDRGAWWATVHWVTKESDMT